MIDIAWTFVVIGWTVVTISFSITKIKVHRCGGGIYATENNPLEKKEKWIIRALVLVYIILTFFIALKFRIFEFDNLSDISRPYFYKLGGVVFLIAMILFLRARFAISSNWGWDKKAKHDVDKLIRKGPYLKVRHPQYAAYLLLVFATGIILLKSCIIIFCLMLVPLVYLKLRVEEECLKAIFPKEYPDYIKKTRVLF